MSQDIPVPTGPVSRQSRSVARLAVVQALYQMEVSGAGVEAVIREFSDHRFDRDVEGFALSGADEAFFAELLRGVIARQAEFTDIDGSVHGALVDRAVDDTPASEGDDGVDDAYGLHASAVCHRPLRRSMAARPAWTSS